MNPKTYKQIEADKDKVTVAEAVVFYLSFLAMGFLYFWSVNVN